MRRSELRRKSKIQASAALAATGIPRQRTRMRSVSEKLKQRDKHYQQQRVRARERAGGRCVYQMKRGGGRCSREAQEIHHLGGRGGPNPHRDENLIALCAHHHRYIHEHPDESYRRGYMTRRNTVREDPE